ncbi:hypothetical protein PsYK624_136920 [Phanerochaete sordida]|uniref:Uncharacterized protein n=1 Tax=Phanerochaete sordida TaxID=48140 RepID=A0A9P3GMH0_9APHY|nr:hypothetical protein PsYK624_136920 [Phanerochaete sordida]
MRMPHILQAASWWQPSCHLSEGHLLEVLGRLHPAQFMWFTKQQVACERSAGSLRLLRYSTKLSFEASLARYDETCQPLIDITESSQGRVSRTWAIASLRVASALLRASKGHSLGQGIPYRRLNISPATSFIVATSARCSAVTESSTLFAHMRKIQAALGESLAPSFLNARACVLPTECTPPPHVEALKQMGYLGAL